MAHTRQSRLEYGLDCLICAIFARQRVPGHAHHGRKRGPNPDAQMERQVMSPCTSTSLDCLICGLDCLRCGIDCLVCAIFALALTVVYVPYSLHSECPDMHIMDENEAPTLMPRRRGRRSTLEQGGDTSPSSLRWRDCAWNP